MNRKTAIALVVAAAAVAGNAFAESPTALKEEPFVSTASRTQVNAELAAYKQAGVNPWSTSYNPLRAFQSVKSRDQVVGEYIAARDQVHALTGEDSGSSWLAQGAPRNAFGDTLAGRPANAQ